MIEHKQQAIVIGGGPAGLMAAQVMAQAGLAVCVYDQMPSLGRKFLLAGRGGLNLTHSEPMAGFIQRYDVPLWLAPHINAFPPEALRQWADDLGESTFIGSSGRVFPRSFKTSPLLRAWLQRLTMLGVQFHPRHRLVALEPGAAILEGPGGQYRHEARAIVLAMGGASWAKLGSDGAWAALLRAVGVAVQPLAPANCGVTIGWTSQFRDRFAGASLKSIALGFAGRVLRGSVTITRTGLEGGIVYALSAPFRTAFQSGGAVRIAIDLRPDTPVDQLATKLMRARGKRSLSTHLRKSVGLDPAAIALMHEASLTVGGPLPTEPVLLAAFIKAVPVLLNGMAGIERAISSSGGVSLAELTDGLMLHRHPGVFCAGEMLDWEGPTGGYLLQACLSTGYVAGNHAADWARSAGSAYA